MIPFLSPECYPEDLLKESFVCERSKVRNVAVMWVSHNSLKMVYIGLKSVPSNF
jgi:hypothetical protein